MFLLLLEKGRKNKGKGGFRVVDLKFAKSVFHVKGKWEFPELMSNHWSAVRSGLWLSLSRTFTRSSLSLVSEACAVFIVLVIVLLQVLQGLLICCLSTFIFLFLFIYTILPGPAAEKHPRSLMLPPPCFSWWCRWRDVQCLPNISSGLMAKLLHLCLLTPKNLLPFDSGIGEDLPCAG